ncbi:MAG: ABC transporter permease [Bowdeniella nasicola]|nr:ABC transporter permease [Bowdeniella nasicola]
MKTTMIVARRELRTNLFKPSSLISVLVFIVLLVGGMIVMNYFTHSEADSPDVTIGTPADSELSTALEAASTDVEVEIREVSSEAEARSLIEEGDIDGYVTGEPATPTVLVAPGEGERVIELATALSQRAALAAQIEDLGGDMASISQAVATAAPNVVLTSDEEAEIDGKNLFFAMVALGVLLFTLITGGATLGMGVVEEKSSRVVEILLATIRPSQLLAGKIIGIGASLLIQLALYAAAILITGSVLGMLDGVEMASPPYLIQLLAWAVIGYLIYALLWGSLSATVSRQEDIGAITTPMTFLSLGAFYLSIFLVPNSPDATATLVLSQVPFFAPFMIPMRQALGGIETWEIALGYTLSIAMIGVLLWLGATIYKRAILHSGGRMKLSEALRRTP